MVIRVGDVKSPKGIFMHPPPPDGGAVSITYTLDQKFSLFRAEVSLNDTAPPMIEGEPVVYTVYGDGKRLWRSREIWSQVDADKCEVSVEGVRELKIELVREGEPMGAHGVWLEPRLTK